MPGIRVDSTKSRMPSANVRSPLPGNLCELGIRRGELLEKGYRHVSGLAAAYSAEVAFGYEGRACVSPHFLRRRARRPTGCLYKNPLGSDSRFCVSWLLFVVSALGSECTGAADDLAGCTVNVE